MKSVKKVLRVLEIIFVFGIFVSQAYATPTLGVATDSGIYAYTDPSALTDEYINYFADTIVPAFDDYEGFVIGPSGSDLTIFTSYNPSVEQIYLLAEVGAGENLPLTFNGSNPTGISPPSTFISGTAPGFGDKPYAYWTLSQNSSDWTTHIFESSRTFYLYTGPITYSGDWTLGYYFFSSAETNGTAGLKYAGGGGGQKDDTSPKTTSAGGEPVPEPATMFLLLPALGGIAIWGRKRA